MVGGNVSRAERRSIVDEVESQIYDMLATRTEQEPAAALADVLSTLDAPEAYVADSAATATVGTAPTASAPGRWPPAGPRPPSFC